MHLTTTLPPAGKEKRQPSTAATETQQRGGTDRPTLPQAPTVTRLGCETCARRMQELGVKPTWAGRCMQQRSVSPMACMWPVQEQTVAEPREAVVQAFRKVLRGESWRTAGAELKPHKSYRGEAVTALDARVQVAVDDLARRCIAREHVWLQCSCTCPCQPRRQKLACHACELAAEAFSRACTAALGTPMQPDTPLLRALLTGRRVLTLLFGGPEREAGEGGIDDAVWDRGSAAAVYDRDRPGPFGDLRSGANTGHIVAACKAGWTDVFSAAPCESFTCLRLLEPPPGEREAPPLRLRSYLPGLPPTPPGWEEYLEEHEGFVDLTADSITGAVRAGRRGGAENPIDKGDKLGRRHFYREHFAEHAPLTLHPRILQMKAELGLQEIDFTQCMSGATAEKGTTIIADDKSAAALRPVAATKCIHPPKWHKEARGRDAEGRSRSKQSAYYKPVMNSWVAAAFTDGYADDVAAIMASSAAEQRRLVTEAGQQCRDTADDEQPQAPSSGSGAPAEAQQQRQQLPQQQPQQPLTSTGGEADTQLQQDELSESYSPSTSGGRTVSEPSADDA